MFFGTPHKGSSAASWGDFAANALRAASLGTSTNRQLMKDLKIQSEVLAETSKSFVDRSKALKIISFCESDKMDLLNFKVCLHHWYS